MRLGWKRFIACSAALFVLAALSRAQRADNAMNMENVRSGAEQIYALANEARAQAGVGKLEWDPALAAAALKHCQLMAMQGPIAHRYQGEPELSDRAAQAGAHFDVIEENVAFGPTSAGIHEQWMESPGHRRNLLSPEVNRVGIAIIAGRGEYYAVADYSHAVEALPQHAVEEKVAALVRRSGVQILSDPSVAREACPSENGLPPTTGGMQPHFIMRWQDSDLSQLPQALAERLTTGQYRAAAVGSCPAQDPGGAFTAYRLAVILY